MIFNNFDSKFILSPMAGVNNIAFREMCARYHKGLNFTEMVSSTALYFKSDKTEKIFEKGKYEENLGVQIFGSNVLHLTHAAELISNLDYVKVLDLNMGCPASKIVKNGDGSALTLEPSKVDIITREIRKVVKKPFSVKIRIGYYEDKVNCFDILRILESNGVDFVTIHGRFTKQMYKGKSNWDVIKKAKESVSIPIIANGDVFNFEDGYNILEKTGCKYAAVGRGAQGRPWLFEDLNEYIEAKENNVEYVRRIRSHKFIVQNLIDHYNKVLSYEDSKKSVLEMRKHASWYLKGLEGSSEIKLKIYKLLDIDEIFKILEEYKNL